MSEVRARHFEKTFRPVTMQEIWDEIRRQASHVERARLHKLLAKLHFEGNLPAQESQELDDLVITRLQLLKLRKARKGRGRG